MKQIIIIGTGKAAMLHYRAYCMFVARENIFFIDPYFKQSNDEIIVFPDVEEALEKINSSKENIIVDICTPCSEFINLIKKCKDNGLYSIVVEKPFIIDNNALNSLCDGLNLVMIQNYLYSEITKTIKKIITENNLNIIKISTDFSKNRIFDSGRMRGIIDGKVPTVFEIEIPHQIYIMDYLLDTNGNEEIYNVVSKDMDLKNCILKNHGFGIIEAKYKEIYIEHISNLMAKNTKKSINIFCEDNIEITADYIIYDKNLQKITNGMIKVLKNDKILYQKTFESDDNILFCLKEYYEYFSSSTINDKYLNRIRYFNKTMFKINNKLEGETNGTN